MSAARRIAASALLVAVAGLVGAVGTTGCVKTTTSSDGRSPAPDPVPAPMTPDQAPANAVVIISKPAIDTNGNQWRDRIEVTVYLFAQPYPTPVFREGAMDVFIYPMGRAGSPDKPGKPLRTWKIEGDALLQARTIALPGPCYQLGISLLDAGGDDRIPFDSVDLAVSFSAPGAPPVWTQGVTTVQLGAMHPGSRGG